MDLADFASFKDEGLIKKVQAHLKLTYVSAEFVMISFLEAVSI